MMVTHCPSFVEGGPYWSTKRTLKNLKFADGTERCEIRRDVYAMGGNTEVLTEFEIGEAG